MKSQPSAHACFDVHGTSIYVWNSLNKAAPKGSEKLSDWDGDRIDKLFPLVSYLTIPKYIKKTL